MVTQGKKLKLYYKRDRHAQFAGIILAGIIQLACVFFLVAMLLSHRGKKLINEIGNFSHAGYSVC